MLFREDLAWHALSKNQQESFISTLYGVPPLYPDGYKSGYHNDPKTYNEKNDYPYIRTLASTLWQALKDAADIDEVVQQILALQNNLSNHHAEIILAWIKLYELAPAEHRHLIFQSLQNIKQNKVLFKESWMHMDKIIEVYANLYKNKPDTNLAQIAKILERAKALPEFIVYGSHPLNIPTNLESFFHANQQVDKILESNHEWLETSIQEQVTLFILMNRTFPGHPRGGYVNNVFEDIKLWAEIYKHTNNKQRKLIFTQLQTVRPVDSQEKLSVKVGTQDVYYFSDFREANERSGRITNAVKSYLDFCKDPSLSHARKEVAIEQIGDLPNIFKFCGHDLEKFTAFLEIWWKTNRNQTSGLDGLSISQINLFYSLSNGPQLLDIWFKLDPNTRTEVDGDIKILINDFGIVSEELVKFILNNPLEKAKALLKDLIFLNKHIGKDAYLKWIAVYENNTITEQDRPGFLDQLLKLSKEFRVSFDIWLDIYQKYGPKGSEPIMNDMIEMFKGHKELYLPDALEVWRNIDLDKKSAIKANMIIFMKYCSKADNSKSPHYILKSWSKVNSQTQTKILPFIKEVLVLQESLEVWEIDRLIHESESKLSDNNTLKENIIRVMRFMKDKLQNKPDVLRIIQILQKTSPEFATNILLKIEPLRERFLEVEFLSILEIMSQHETIFYSIIEPVFKKLEAFKIEDITTHAIIDTILEEIIIKMSGEKVEKTIWDNLTLEKKEHIIALETLNKGESTYRTAVLTKERQYSIKLAFSHRAFDELKQLSLKIEKLNVWKLLLEVFELMESTKHTAEMKLKDTGMEPLTYQERESLDTIAQHGPSYSRSEKILKRLLADGNVSNMKTVSKALRDIFDETMRMRQ
ncbi:MAG: hypothetical protein H6850_00580 [Alphaproteobacteria bacterium]|nr:MAG: hypothetical protein H6850_00580 [Alphaproteobacteria bacterium]